MDNLRYVGFGENGYVSVRKATHPRRCHACQEGDARNSPRSLWRIQKGAFFLTIKTIDGWGNICEDCVCSAYDAIANQEEKPCIHRC